MERAAVDANDDLPNRIEGQYQYREEGEVDREFMKR
jgi:hypothetical protein